ncbi:MAG TPA: thioesterase family protein [Bryobacteraceae bacterium]|jgi:acyl-CoA thioester hydrolase|nr:thioesterase family protein [Bryobacteraceae bacterium]
MPAFVWESRIRFVDTDASGRIHYTALLRHFEAAEFEFLRSLGVSYHELEGGYPRVHVECDYLSALVCDDLIATAVRVLRVGGSSFTLGYEASVAGRAAATGRITIVCIDKATQRSRPLPALLAERLRAASA